MVDRKKTLYESYSPNESSARAKGQLKTSELPASVEKKTIAVLSPRF
jgi:hypothetical protein